MYTTVQVFVYTVKTVF